MEKLLKPIFGVYWNYVALAIFALVAFFGYKKYQQFEDDKRRKDILQDHDEGTHVVDGAYIPGNPNPGTQVTVNTYTIALSCYNAIWRYFGGWLEDEATFVKEVLKCPKHLIPQVADYYAQQPGGKNFYSDASKYLEPAQYSQIAHLLS